jgi:hypothetical protein
MAFPTPKELKKLADTCRKAGIKHFKCEGMEFTLADDLPSDSPKAAKHNHGVTDRIETDSLSPDELLFWSTGVASHGAEENTQ